LVVVRLVAMNVLPRQRVGASEWAHNAWAEVRGGPALTVPSDALQALLDAYVTAMRALEDDVRGEIRERAESVRTVDAVGVSAEA
jgi:hypothetical protein